MVALNIIHWLLMFKVHNAIIRFEHSNTTEPFESSKQQEQNQTDKNLI